MTGLAGSEKGLSKPASTRSSVGGDLSGYDQHAWRRSSNTQAVYYISREDLVPQGHPLRAIRPRVDAALERRSSGSDAIILPSAATRSRLKNCCGPCCCKRSSRYVRSANSTNRQSERGSGCEPVTHSRKATRPQTCQGCHGHYLRSHGDRAFPRLSDSFNHLSTA